MSSLAENMVVIVDDDPLLHTLSTRTSVVRASYHQKTFEHPTIIP